MGTPTVSQKIDAYAKAHLTELKLILLSMS